MAGESPTDLSKWGPGAGVGRASIMMLVACSWLMLAEQGTVRLTQRPG